MKESYSICFTSHNEVMFRDEEDHGMFLNLLALRCYTLGAEVLADAEMSTHCHLNIFTDRPVACASLLRMSYTKWFNRKYGRGGRFGEKYSYVLKVNGFNHQLVLDNYILRNGLHHGAAPTAFGYPFCSARALFAEDLGFPQEKPRPMKRNEIASLLPRYAEFPDSYQMNEHGVFVRQSFMELRRVEQFYVTPRNYLFQMNRLTDESWIQEQLKDRTETPPITLQNLERADERSVSEMLKNETGRHFNRSKRQDMEVCRIIDKDLLHGLGSVYYLNDWQKTKIYKTLLYDFHLPESQICRCLAVPRRQ